MTSFLSEEERANVRNIAKIELPHSLLTEIDVGSLGGELKQAIDRSKSSQRQLASAKDAKWWEIWRWGDKDKAIVNALMSMQEYQQATTKISAYNIWLSHKVLETEEVLKKQNDRIESAQSDIKGKMSEADATLAQFRREVTKVRDDLIHYLQEAERERQSLSASADKAEELLVQYAEKAAVIRSQIEMTNTLTERVAGIERWGREFSLLTQSKLNDANDAIDNSVFAQNSRLDSVRAELEYEFSRDYRTVILYTGLTMLITCAFFAAIWLRLE